jgi:hypothetical protein
MDKCNREAVYGEFLPCHRAEEHTGPCAHEIPVMVHIVEELNQWNEHKILLVTGSLTAAQDLMSERLKDYNRPYQPGYWEYVVDCVQNEPRLAEDWQYHPIYPEYWKNGKGHYLKLSTYKV